MLPIHCLMPLRVAKKLGNKLATISAEHHRKPTRMVQDELRRINTTDNPTYLDTVEVIGSIPVAPIVLSRLNSIIYVQPKFHPVRLIGHFSAITVPRLDQFRV